MVASNGGSAPGGASGPRVHSFTFPTMGTLGRVSWSGGVEEADLFSALVARAHEIEARLTRFSQHSEISCLDETWRLVSGDTAAVMDAARAHHTDTRGHFSALMGAQMRAWTEIASAASSTKSAGVESDEGAHTVRVQAQVRVQVIGEQSLPTSKRSPYPASGTIEVDGMRCRVTDAPPRAVDLGGIAKGYAADQLRDLAVALGAGDVLVSLGTSSMAVAGLPARIGLASPWAGWERAGVLTLSQGSLAVSADPGTVPGLSRRDGPTRQHSHVLAPSTGEPALTDLCCVIVRGADGMACEAYSTAYLAMGLDAAMELDAEHPELDTMFFTVNGRMLASPALGFVAQRGIQEWLAVR